jgi:hypothetical protein
MAAQTGKAEGEDGIDGEDVADGNRVTHFGVSCADHCHEREGPVTNSQMHAAIALGTALMASVFIAFLPPVPPASAQSQAQRICREQGVKADSEAYEYCLSQATRALEWGEPQLAYSYAQVAADARDACLSFGLRVRTAGLQACIDKETTRRALFIYASEQIKYGPQIADHP